MDVPPSTSLKLMATQGGEFWKYHYRQVSRPTRVHMQLLTNTLDATKDVIVWKDVGDRDWCASVAVTDIVDVKKGPSSRTFEENLSSIINPNMCISIYTRGRTLDIEAVHPEDFKIWVQGLMYLAEPRRFKGPSSYGDNSPDWHFQNGRAVIAAPKRAESGLGGLDLITDLEQHLDRGFRNGDTLEGIQEWVAMKRQTNINRPIREAPNEALDVDQMLLAGQYRNDMVSPTHRSPAFPVPSTPERGSGHLLISSHSPTHNTPTRRDVSAEYSTGFEEGMRVAALMRSQQSEERADRS